jgi:hypothetical protein
MRGDRPGAAMAGLATVLGVWLGLAAPDASPVAAPAGLCSSPCSESARS